MEDIRENEYLDDQSVEQKVVQVIESEVPQSSYEGVSADGDIGTNDIEEQVAGSDSLDDEAVYDEGSTEADIESSEYEVEGDTVDIDGVGDVDGGGNIFTDIAYSVGGGDSESDDYFDDPNDDGLEDYVIDEDDELSEDEDDDILIDEDSLESDDYEDDGGLDEDDIEEDDIEVDDFEEDSIELEDEDGLYDSDEDYESLEGDYDGDEDFESSEDDYDDDFVDENDIELEDDEEE